MMREKKGILVSKSFEFALQVVKLYKFLTEHQKEYVLSKQLLRSGTAIGALVREAQNAESKADFVHKLAIAQKECDESIYWLDLLHKSEYLEDKVYINIVGNNKSLLKMLRAAILTTKKNHKL